MGSLSLDPQLSVCEPLIQVSSVHDVYPSHPTSFGSSMPCDLFENQELHHTLNSSLDTLCWDLTSTGLPDSPMGAELCQNPPRLNIPSSPLSSGHNPTSSRAISHLMEPTFKNTPGQISQGCPPRSTQCISKSSNSMPTKTKAKSARIYPCQNGCSKFFPSLKDRRRHYLSNLHQSLGNNFYKCRCLYRTPRKDHYLRHIRRRRCVSASQQFECICPSFKTAGDYEEHLAHVVCCEYGAGTAGRPRGLPLVVRSVSPLNR